MDRQKSDQPLNLAADKKGSFERLNEKSIY